MRTCVIADLLEAGILRWFDYLQAMECKLSGLDGWNDDVGAEAAMLINSDDHYVLMTVEPASESSPAKVQLSQNSYSINNTLLKIYEQR